ncbi:MAG: DUF167 domain-containing protein [Burkholderiaceae bacterium]
MNKAWCTTISGGIRLAVQITPNAKKSEVIGLLEDVLKIRLQAQPIEGKANEALTRYIADMLAVPKSAVSITHGHTNKRKMVEISAPQLTVETVSRTFLPMEKSH